MIKILITEATDQGLTALIESGKVEEGKKYHLEDATSGTLAQNRFFHLLLDIFDKTDVEMTTTEQRSWVKNELGEGLGECLYWDGNAWIHVPTKEDIPAEIRKDRSRCFGKLKSWSDYTLPQRKKCIDKLIRHMEKIGVASKRFDEICKEFYDG